MEKVLESRKQAMISNLKNLLSWRRIELILADTAIMCSVYFLMVFLSGLAIGSLEINGDFTIRKFFAMYACVMLIRFFFSIYNCIWRYANVRTYLKLMAADVIGNSIFFLIGRMCQWLYLGFAYTLVNAMLVFTITLASRFLYQFLYAYVGQRSDARLLRTLFDEGDFSDSSIHKINVAIVGAGNIGATLAEEFVRNPRSYYYPYCFIDRDVAKIGSEMNGIHIYPEDETIVERIREMPVQEIFIALPDATSEDRARLFELYRQTDCKVKMYDYPVAGYQMENKGSKRVLREFRIEDLLFRDARTVTSMKARTYYRDKVILISGGGGSIGSQICRSVAKLSPKHLVILDIYENNAYDIQQELLREYGDSLHFTTYIASVRDAERLDEIFAEVKPDIVFHAAAHKHVPLMEDSGCEAIKNNVFGTWNMANTAEKYEVERFVLISTDKAVNPTNIMGATKRLCEMIIQSRKDSRTEFAAVRFGNVLGSNGSVIPLFKQQIENQGPITITDKRIVRYFMTIPEAVELVLEAGAMAKNTELFVLDMGKPVKILDLAENMIRLSGLKPYEDIDIVEIGLRPGEKLYEELLMKTGELDKTENEMIFIERDQPSTREEMEEKVRILRKAVEYVSDGNLKKQGHYELVRNAIRHTVPTYHDPEEINEAAMKSEEMRSVKVVLPMMA